MRWHRSRAIFLPRITIYPALRAALLLACLVGCLGTVAADGQAASVAETSLPSAGGGSDLDVAYGTSEARLLAEARRGKVDGRWLFEAALAADGVVEPAALANYRRRWQAWHESLRDGVREGSSARDRARAVFMLLHREALVGGYVADATGLRSALGSTGYNCVSATILFNSLAVMVGLNVVAVETPEHVYSVVRSREGEFAVEMTCRRWFELTAAAQREALAERSSDTGSRPMSPPETNIRNARRELSPAGLVALVYYNAGIDRLSRGEFRESLAANLKALAFDPANTLAHGNLLATLNNWALNRYESRDFATAARLIEYGRVIAPDHRPYQANLAAIYERWSEQLLAEGKPAQARAIAALSRRVAP